MSPIRVAIVGCGRISDLHAAAYQDYQKARIVAVCDTNGKHARQKARAWEVDKVYTDYQALLADPEVDLVELLVPHHLHAPLTIAACQAGKHVSVQKPMALTPAEADQMIAAADKAGVVLRVYETFVFYPPAVKARQMIQAGEIGEPQMIRLHVNTGSRDKSWNVPLGAWLWRFNSKQSGGGPLVFDHGYHLFSLAYDLMGEVERVFAWIDKSRVAPGIYVDAPATIMFQFKAPRRYGMLDFEHTPKMVIESRYYADDDRVEVIGERGSIFINRYTTRTIDLPELMLFRDGKTTPIPVERVDWQESFTECTRHLVDVLTYGGQPKLDGRTGKAVLQFTLAALQSAAAGREVCPSQVTGNPFI